MTERKRIAIVGGGIAGLTAALRLAQSGHEVTLWERAPKFGGQAGAFEVEGGKLEYFYHHLFQSDTQITELIQELGIGDRLAWLPRMSATSRMARSIRSMARRTF
ncbi:MAG: FAD-dependent oxidoreductase [Thermomicrobiales bacterium]